MLILGVKVVIKFLFYSTDQAPVVQRPDNFIQWISSLSNSFKDFSISSCTNAHAHSNHSLGVYENLG